MEISAIKIPENLPEFNETDCRNKYILANIGQLFVFAPVFRSKSYNTRIESLKDLA